MLAASRLSLRGDLAGTAVLKRGCHTSATSQLWAEDAVLGSGEVWVPQHLPDSEYATDERAKLRPPCPETSQAGSGLHKGVMRQLERKDKRSMVKNCLKKMIQMVETRLGSWETQGKDSSSGSSKELRQQPAHPTLCVHSLSMRMAL